MADFDEYAKYWRMHLLAENKSKTTVDWYIRNLGYFAAWLKANDLPDDPTRVRLPAVNAYFAWLRDQPGQKADTKMSSETIAGRWRALQQFWKYMTEVEELPKSPMSKLEKPKVPVQPVEVFTDAEIERMLRAARYKFTKFQARRNTAILRVFLETGARLGEVAKLKPDDVDFVHYTVHVHGKGRKDRTIPFGPKCGLALRHYMRERSSYWHEGDKLWLGERGSLTASGISILFRKVQAESGVHMHPHKFRHTFAHNWLMSGGGETDLMRIMGWESRKMLEIYAASAGSERAHHAYRKLNLYKNIS